MAVTERTNAHPDEQGCACITRAVQAQAREQVRQEAERAAQARRAAIVQQERARLLLAAAHVHDFLPPGTLTREDRAALDVLREGQGRTS